MTRRAFDVCVSAVLIVVLVPAWIACTILVKLSSPGPIVHRASRVGRGARRFTLLKFRTMVPGAADQGPGITTEGDTRITAVGRYLRRWRLDETLQLLNVLRGDMSLVGPRPEDPRYVERYTPAQRRLLEVRPGMTSPATLAFRHEERLLDRRAPEAHYLEVILPQKLAIDLQYLDRRSTAKDCAVLVKTLTSVLGRERPRSSSS